MKVESSSLFLEGSNQWVEVSSEMLEPSGLFFWMEKLCWRSETPLRRSEKSPSSLQTISGGLYKFVGGLQWMVRGLYKLVGGL